jgi:uroporphyrinogen decarboxylase
MNTLQRRKPDYTQFLKAVTRSGKPSHLPFYEHFASSGFIARRTGKPFDRMSWDDPALWPTYVDFWLGMGFDCIPMEVGLRCPLPSEDQGGVSEGSESHACIRTDRDFETYPWPEESNPIDFKPFEIVAAMIPDGVKIVGGVAMGPYEWVSRMMGVQGLSLALFDNPPLVERMFEKLGRLALAADRVIAQMDAVCALRQGDDLGFKTATFLSPADLRRLVFPTYAQMVEIAHGEGKPFILHSCGNLAQVYEDLIGCGIDAKHSFEETIMPVEVFKRLYGRRITPLGGLDVDMICRAPEDELRRYTRGKVEQCFADGWWTLGTGNSLTDYMPVERYLMVLEEGLTAAGG